jgi:hypothetical protein
MMPSRDPTQEKTRYIEARAAQAAGSLNDPSRLRNKPTPVATASTRATIVHVNGPGGEA